MISFMIRLLLILVVVILILWVLRNPAAAIHELFAIGNSIKQGIRNIPDPRPTPTR